MKILGDERGQAMMLMLLCMTCLLGFVALAVDIGMMFRAKRVMQIAADSAAVAGAAELNYGDVTAAADAAATQNGLTNGANGATVAINTPPQTGPHAGNARYVEAIVGQNQPTFFLKLFRLNTMNVKARAVATLANTENCIYTLNPNGVDFLMSGGDTLTAPDCGIVDDSTSNQALMVSGTDQLTARWIGTVGHTLESGFVNVTPNPVSGIAAETNPLQFLPAPTFNAGSCTALIVTANTTLGPPEAGGTVCYSSLLISGYGINVTLQPGMYVMDGPFIVSGSPTITGNGVTFYFPNAGASFIDSGLTTLNLTAPTSGTYNGILLYQDPSDTQPMILSGGNNSTFTGIFYLPTANLLISGLDNDSLYADIVAGSLTISGIVHIYDYADVNPNSPLTSARLVE